MVTSGEMLIFLLAAGAVADDPRYSYVPVYSGYRYIDNQTTVMQSSCPPVLQDLHGPAQTTPPLCCTKLQHLEMASTSAQSRMSPFAQPHASLPLPSLPLNGGVGGGGSSI